MIKTCVGVVPHFGIIEPNQFNEYIQIMPRSSWQHLLGEEIEVINWIGEYICIRRFRMVSRFVPELLPLFVILEVAGERSINPDDYDAFYLFLQQEHGRTKTD